MKPANSSLRPRKKQHTELLSFTNAAVKALAEQSTPEEQRKSSKLPSKDVSFSQQNNSSSDPSFTARETSSSSDQRAVLKLGNNSSLSSTSFSENGNLDRMDKSSSDSSFNTSTAVRVRVPSRLLKEIKPPVDRSVDSANVSITGMVMMMMVMTAVIVVMMMMT